jgi:protein-S-isoprenylcysteine O-methyltransferase Ste14
LELAFILTLCFFYGAIWEINRRRLKRQLGFDPFVYPKSSSKLQSYFKTTIQVLAFAFLLLIVSHGAGIAFFSFFSTSELLDHRWVDTVGFFIGVLGLLICAAAQITMGKSWRMGLDEKNAAEFVDRGIYRFVRHPTYLGQYLLCCALWLIWPSWSVALYIIVFFVLLEAQVRCEEEYMEKQHGEAYRAYCLRTRRYLPLRKSSKRSSP